MSLTGQRCRMAPRRGLVGDVDGAEDEVEVAAVEEDEDAAVEEDEDAVQRQLTLT